MVAVRIDAGIGSIGHTAAVSTMCADRIIVTGHTSAARSTGVGGVSVVAGVGVVSSVSVVSGVTDARGAAVVTITVNTGVSHVGYTATVGTVSALRVIVASGVVVTSGVVCVGASACTAKRAGGGTVITVTVDAGVSSIGYTTAVGTVSALSIVITGMGASFLVLVGVESLLNFVDKSRHVGSYRMLIGLEYVVCEI